MNDESATSHAVIRQCRMRATRALLLLVMTAAFYAMLPILESSVSDVLGAGAKVVLAWMRGVSIAIIVAEAVFAIGFAAAATMIERRQAATDRRG